MTKAGVVPDALSLQTTMEDMHVCMLSRFSRVRLFATLWTVTCQVSLSMGLPRQEYCGLLYPPPRDFLPPCFSAHGNMGRGIFCGSKLAVLSGSYNRDFKIAEAIKPSAQVKDESVAA